MRSATPAFRLLDTHLHLPAARPTGGTYRAWDLSESGFVDHLDRCGIGQGVIHAVAGDETPDNFIEANREVLRFLERFPRRFAGACAVSLSLVEESLREMEDWKNRYGMVWVAETDFDPQWPRSRVNAVHRILEQAASLNLIVSLNTSPEGIRQVAERHPDATVVFPQLEQGRAFQRIRFAGSRESFYLDTSPRGYERMGLIEAALETLGPGRLLYGSNFCFSDPAAVIARVENAFLSTQQKEAVFSENALSLLEAAGWTF